MSNEFCAQTAEKERIIEIYNEPLLIQNCYVSHCGYCTKVCFVITI